MARTAHQITLSTQARRAGAAVLVALFLVIGAVLTLGGGGFGAADQGIDVAGKSWWRIVQPATSPDTTASVAKISKVIVVDGKSWA